MRNLRKYLVTAALTGGLAFAGATGSAAAAPAQEQAPAGALAFTCANWAEVPGPGLWGRSCRNSAPVQGAGEAYNGRTYNVRIRISVMSKTPLGDAFLGTCDGWVAPGKSLWCGDFYLGVFDQYPVVAYFQQLQP